MGLTLVSGTISMLRERTTVTGDAHSVSTRQSTEFRIGDRPATLAAACNLTIGDKVTAAGHAKAELTVLALRNDTTNVVYSIAPTPLWSIGFMVLSPFAGIAVMLQDPSWAFPGTILLLGGLVFLPMGLIGMRKNGIVSSARRMVEQAPRS